jgi:hypothetical protein
MPGNGHLWGFNDVSGDRLHQIANALWVC